MIYIYLMMSYIKYIICVYNLVQIYDYCLTFFIVIVYAVY